MKFRPGGKALQKKSIADVAKSGTHVPEKDFSPAKKEAKAAKDGPSGGGSLAKANSLPTMLTKPNETPEKGRSAWEGSHEDWKQDYHGAKRVGKSVEDYEDSARDRIGDKAGEKNMKAADDSKEYIKHAPGYKAGVSAYSNRPKASHGFGHSSSCCDGHLRNSGHSGAHRIGKK